MKSYSFYHYILFSSKKTSNILVDVLVKEEKGQKPETLNLLLASLHVQFIFHDLIIDLIIVHTHVKVPPKRNIRIFPEFY